MLSKLLAIMEPK